MKQDNPERGVRLLWDAPAEPSRGPKPTLSLARVVAAGIDVADEEGLAALTMRRVAERLGFTTMSLYRYVPGKSELLDLMLDAAAGEMELTSGPWRDGLEFYARESWKVYRAHPWTVQLSGTRRTPGPNTLKTYDAALATVSKVGLSGAEMAAVVTLVGQYVDGVARKMAEQVQALRETGMTEEDWWSKRPTVWDNVTPERFPMMTHVYLSGGFAEPLDEFEFGLARVLDGIAAFIDAEERPVTPLSTCD